MPRCPLFGHECDCSPERRAEATEVVHRQGGQSSTSQPARPTARATSGDEESSAIAPLPSSPPTSLILVLGGSVELLILLGVLPSPVDPFGDWLFAVPDGPDRFWDEPLLV